MSEMMLGKDDLIRRQDAIKALEKWKEGEARTTKDYGEVFVLGRTSAFADAIAAMVFVPSAEPERKSGHWINAECKDGTTAHKCSECKCFVGYSVSSLTWFNFCPWCGADMRGEK